MGLCFASASTYATGTHRNDRDTCNNHHDEGAEMTRDDVIRLAREVADKDKVDPVCYGEPEFVVLTPAELLRFSARILRAAVAEIRARGEA